jgi:hypothetical protein
MPEVTPTAVTARETNYSRQIATSRLYLSLEKRRDESSRRDEREKEREREREIFIAKVQAAGAHVIADERIFGNIRTL